MGRTTNRSGSNMRQGKGTISPCTAFRMTLRPTHPRIQLEAMTIFARVRRVGRETDHLPPSSDDSAKKYILIRSNKMQQYAGIYLLQNYSTCFGCLSQPSSGVHQIVTAASGTGRCSNTMTCTRSCSYSLVYS